MATKPAPKTNPRITEFIPVNVWLICGLFTLIAMSIVGIEALHYQTQLRLADHSSSNAQIAPAETSQTPADAPNAGVAVNAVSDDDQVIEKSSIAKSDLSAVTLSAVDVTKFGSLASTMGGGILLAAAICGLLIYRLRKHKNDDYTGTYRVWIWVPAVLLLVALEQQTGISQAIVGWLGHFGFAEYLAPELSVGTIATSLLLAGLTIRLLFEMREWRLGTGLLLTTASLYVITLLTQLQIIQLSNLLHQQILASTLLLTAHTSTLLTAIFYQRFVYLDSQGKIVIPVREPRAAKRKRGEKNGRGIGSGSSPASQEAKAIGSGQSTAGGRAGQASPAEKGRKEIGAVKTCHGCGIG